MNRFSRLLIMYKIVNVILPYLRYRSRSNFPYMDMGQGQVLKCARDIK